MVVGKPDPTRLGRIRPRPTQEVVLHYNRYDAKRAKAQLATYEKTFQEFRTASGMNNKLWKDSVVYAANSMDYMHGRQNLRTTVEERGFGLQ
jgi:hypothetical protein